MNKKIIPCRVRDGYVEGSGVAAGAAGSGGDTLLQLEFGPMWEGLVRYVTFRDARKENPVTVILTTDMIERIVVPGKAECPGAGAQCAPLPNGEACPCREVLVYNVPIPAKAMAIAGQMGVVVQGYELTEDGQRVQAATMTANAYYKILPADYADNVEDGSVTPTLSQQLQAQIEKIKTDIMGAADAADAKEAAQKAAQEAQAARDGAEVQARKAEKLAGEAAGSAGEARTAAADARSARELSQAAAEKSETARTGAEEARTAAEIAREAGEAAKDVAQSAQTKAEEARDRAKGYRDEALSARTAAGEAQEKAETAREEAVSAKEVAEECRTEAWMERVLAQDAREKAKEWAEQSGVYKDQGLTAMKRSEDARDEAVLALQWIRMESGDIKEGQEEIRTIGREVRELHESTKIDSEAAREARKGAEKARDDAEESAEKAEEWAQTARDLSGGDVATRREAKGYVKAHNADPLAHEGLFPRIGFVAGERVRDSWRPGYGLGGGGEEGGETSVFLEVEEHTGKAYLSAVVSGVEYDAVNMETDGDLSDNGTLIIKKLEE